MFTLRWFYDIMRRCSLEWKCPRVLVLVHLRGHINIALSIIILSFSIGGNLISQISYRDDILERLVEHFNQCVGVWFLGDLYWAVERSLWVQEPNFLELKLFSQWMYSMISYSIIQKWEGVDSCWKDLSLDNGPISIRKLVTRLHPTKGWREEMSCCWWQGSVNRSRNRFFTV